MPPRNEAELAKKKADRAKATADLNNPHNFNDGSIIADGVRINIGAWADCKTCKGPIKFIRVGDNCVGCPLRIEGERPAASLATASSA